MRRRRSVAIPVLLVAGALGLAVGAAGSGPSAPGSRLWVARTNGGPSDYPQSVATSQDGTRVFVTGYSAHGSGAFDLATVAYDAATGAQLWVARHDNGIGVALTVSPDGSRVYVTGAVRKRPNSWNDMATVAYDAT